MIGNISYSKNPLKNCVNDAQDMAEVLRTLDFQVQLGINCTQQAMSSLISTFARSIGNQDLVLFFFAGHGLQSKEENYLVSVDADERIHEDEDIETTSVNAQSTLLRFSSRTAYLTIFILDCDRTYALPNETRF